MTAAASGRTPPTPTPEKALDLTCATCGGTGRVAKFTEWWIVRSSGFDRNRGLDYWGPFITEAEAKESGMYRPDTVAVEVPA